MQQILRNDERCRSWSPPESTGDESAPVPDHQWWRPDQRQFAPRLQFPPPPPWIPFHPRHCAPVWPTIAGPHSWFPRPPQWQRFHPPQFQPRPSYRPISRRVVVTQPRSPLQPQPPRGDESMDPSRPPPTASPSSQPRRTTTSSLERARISSLPQRRADPSTSSPRTTPEPASPEPTPVSKLRTPLAVLSLQRTPTSETRPQVDPASSTKQLVAQTVCRHPLVVPLLSQQPRSDSVGVPSSVQLEQQQREQEQREQEQREQEQREQEQREQEQREQQQREQQQREQQQREQQQREQQQREQEQSFDETNDRCTLEYTLLSSKAKPLTVSAVDSIGYDICSAYPYTVAGKNTKIVLTDLSIRVPHGTHARVIARDDLFSRHNVTVSSSLIKSAYRGNAGLLIINHGQQPFYVEAGEAIARLVCEVIFMPRLLQAKPELISSPRNEGASSIAGRENISPSVTVTVTNSSSSSRHSTALI